MQVIVRPTLEPTYYDVTAQHISVYATGTFPTVDFL